ncbi:L,D-transpeptidase family protein [Streptomyces sp. NPDC052012]|uniref:L,D-transpeptidase family protein n=1 Tax=Streptomyces sp. NPDC052012 TaxID=3155051 RepID=UPI00344C6847
MASSIDHPHRGSRRASSRRDPWPASLRRARHRLPRPALALLVTVALSGCASLTEGPARDVRPAASPAGGAPAHGAPTQGAPGTASTTQGRAETPAETRAPAPLPGLGPRTLARIPEKSRQVVLVTGRARDANRSEVVLYSRTASGWQAGTPWPARNAQKGWTEDHYLGDLRSPIGVFTLTDAGGLLPDPGTRLPYYQDEGFGISGPGLAGESLEGAFDYVVAIDYNRVPGTSPLDLTRPLGEDKGGGIWLHVDHEGPTQGCVSLSEQHMKDLLRALDPARYPVIVMGDAQSLRQ